MRGWTVGRLGATSPLAVLLVAGCGHDWSAEAGAGDGRDSTETPGDADMPLDDDGSGDEGRDGSGADEGGGDCEDHCSNRVTDCGEIDVDCGGPCSACGPGRRCRDAADCTSGVCIAGVCQPAGTAGRSWEVLGRGLIALPKDGHAYLGWRLLPWDDPDVGFDVYRSDSPAGPYTRVSADPVGRTTDYLDVTAAGGSTYYYLVRAVTAGGIDGPDSNIARVTAGASRNSIDMALLSGFDPPDTLDAAWWTDGVGVGDINGDGVFDFVLMSTYRVVGNPEFMLSPYFIEAVLSEDGAWISMWRVSTGFTSGNNSVVLWDLDGDARAEIVTRTGSAGDLSVLDPAGGGVIASIPWLDAGPYFGTLAAAYLEDTDGDGSPDPFIVTQTGMASVFGAFTYDASSGLVARREMRIPTDGWDPDHPWIVAMGTHGLPIADLDGDGLDEVMPCGSVLYGDWSGYWVIFPDHSDVCFPADIDLDTPGPELFVGSGPNGSLNSLSGGGPAELWRVRAEYVDGWDKGWCSDLTAAHPGLECALMEEDEDEYSSHAGMPPEWLGLRTRVYDARGGEITSEITVELQYDAPMDWVAGDGIKEIVFANCGPAAPPGCVPGRLADYVGDSREESISWDKEAGLLRVFTNIDANGTRRVTPLADRGYRAAVARHGSYGYPTNWITARTNQPRFDILPFAGIRPGTCGGLPAGTVCRAQLAPCDVAEACDGVADVCPADGFAPAGVVCRPSTAGCDPQETCSGDSRDCPSDVNSCSVWLHLYLENGPFDPLHAIDLAPDDPWECHVLNEGGTSCSYGERSCNCCERSGNLYRVHFVPGEDWLPSGTGPWVASGWSRALVGDGCPTGGYPCYAVGCGLR